MGPLPNANAGPYWFNQFHSSWGFNAAGKSAGLLHLTLV